MVVNNVKNQGESFINIGIFDKINKDSDFRPILVMDYEKPDFSMIKKRLGRFPIKTTRTFKIKNFNSLEAHEKLFMLFQIVYIFRALTFEAIIFCMRRILGNAKEDDVRHLLSILIAAHYIERKGVGNEYFVPAPN